MDHHSSLKYWKTFFKWLRTSSPFTSLKNWRIFLKKKKEEMKKKKKTERERERDREKKRKRKSKKRKRKIV